MKTLNKEKVSVNDIVTYEFGMIAVPSKPFADLQVIANALDGWSDIYVYVDDEDELVAWADDILDDQPEWCAKNCWAKRYDCHLDKMGALALCFGDCDEQTLDNLEYFIDWSGLAQSIVESLQHGDLGYDDNTIELPVTKVVVNESKVAA